MKTTKTSTIEMRTTTPEIENGLREKKEITIELASEAGLIDLAPDFAGMMEPQVRELGWALHGRLRVEPAVLRARVADATTRATEATERVRAFFEAVKSAPFQVAPGRPLFAWRGCLIVVLAAGLIGLAGPRATWSTVAVLVLSAALSMLVLPLVPSAVRTCLVAARAVWACARDMAEAARAYGERRNLSFTLQEAEDHVASLDQWVAHHMAQLSAEYKYRKDLAAAARFSR